MTLFHSLKRSFFVCLFIGALSIPCFSAVSKDAIFFADVLKSDGLHQGVGTLAFQPQFNHSFMKRYGSMVLDVEDDGLHLRHLLSGQSGEGLRLGWFPDINSHEFEVGYGMEEITPGEQLLYGLGMMLLQMSAAELDRTINH